MPDRLTFFVVLSIVQISLVKDCNAQTITVSITGNQTVLEGSNVTFSCTVVETSNGTSTKLRTNWFILFHDARTNIRFQGGMYEPIETDRSLFHIPDTFPGLQESFTFVRISREFNMVEVQCFNGGFTNSSFTVFYEPFKFGDDATVSRPESTTDFFPVNITEVGDSVLLSYEWTRNGAVLLSNGRVQYLINGINFTDGQGGMYRNDSGVYKLTISNVAGSAVTYLTLDVQYAPSISGSVMQQEVALQIGLDEIIKCGFNSSGGAFLNGNPFPNTSWQFNNTPITNGSQYHVLDTSLVILNVERNDSGIYNCTAANSVGSDVISYSVVVFDAASSPLNVMVSSITDTTAVITWEEPMFTDGLPVYIYIVHDYTNGMKLGRTWDNTTSITIRNLLPAINYRIVVLAVTRHPLGRTAKGNTSDVTTFNTTMGRPVLDEMVTYTVDDVITIHWSVLTNGGSPILRYIVEWIVPGTTTYAIAPNGRIEDSNVTYLRISFSDVFAGELYQYRIVAINHLERSSSHIFTSIVSSKGLPASPSKPQVSTDIEGVVNVSTRTDVAGVDSTNTTLIFEIDAQSSFETMTRNFTVVMYRISSEVRFAFSGLRAGRSYTFRCRVFNIYGASDYSINSTQITVSGVTVSTTNDDNSDSDTAAIIGGIVGGAILLVLVLLILFIITYVLLQHKNHVTASYSVNGDESEKEPTFSIQVDSESNPQYNKVELKNPSMEKFDITKSFSINDNSYEQEHEPIEFHIAIDKKGRYRPDSLEDLVSPPRSAGSSTLV